MKINKRKVEIQNSSAITPRYIRYPKPKERDPIFGLSRSQLRKIVIQLGVRTISLPMDNKSGRGARLIDVSSLIEKIESHGVKS